MKVSVMNGWKTAPRYWKRYLTRPLIIGRTPLWISVDILGFVFFVGR
jgi:hypothetical protein